MMKSNKAAFKAALILLYEKRRYQYRLYAVIRKRLSLSYQVL